MSRDPDQIETMAAPASAITPSHARKERFAPGTLLASRFRIVSILGKGGMGEVFRADDLILGQPVALKFLPESAKSNVNLLTRFYDEVRIARQISHKNVCRVYDIGEVDGQPYLSMEYIDGEDLGSLLRRIGRLPADKATEFARKLCAAVAAAHAQGVLHRDLKPANIMIDSRGELRVTDFGLATITEQLHPAEIRNGTPAYMAPEQLAGREVTERSDIYSLGLVLFEMFTGKRAFETRDRTAVPSAASVIKDVDPAVERLIAKCLDPDAAKRPQSALAVARALPGGDPLAEALAAGDTPSPEMVAASEDTGALSVRAAVVCMAFVAAGLVTLLLLSSRTSVLRLTPFPNSQEILARQGHDIAARLGYTDPPVDTYDTFNYEDEYHNWAERNLKKDDYRQQVRLGQPSLICFTHRESPVYLETRDPYGHPMPNDPPVNVSGMVSLDLDPQGRLVRFLGVPPQLDDAAAPAQPPTPRMQWTKLFDAAGLDPSRWTETASQEIPPFSFDERKAWTGTFAHAPNMPLRIEAAAWKGRPVSFELFGPWRRPARLQPRAPRNTAQRVVGWSLLVVISIILVGSLWLAVRNFRAGRGDTRGALRLAAFGLIFWSVSEIVRVHHVPTPSGTVVRLIPDRHWVARGSVGLGALHVAGTLPAAALAAESDLVDSSSRGGRARSAGGRSHPGRHRPGRGVYVNSGSEEPDRLAALGSDDHEHIHDLHPGRSGPGRLAALEYDWTGFTRADCFLSRLLASFGVPQDLGRGRGLRRPVCCSQPRRRRFASTHRSRDGADCLRLLGRTSIRYPAHHPRAPAAAGWEPGALHLRPVRVVREPGPDRRRPDISPRGVELPQRARRPQSAPGRFSGTLTHPR